MFYHCTHGKRSTGSRAGITALFVNTSSVTRALRVDHALGPAVGRYPDIAGQAGAGRDATNVFALGVLTARIWHTWVGGPWGQPASRGL